MISGRFYENAKVVWREEISGGREDGRCWRKKQGVKSETKNEGARWREWAVSVENKTIFR